VIHDESPDAEMRRNGGKFHGVQLWINMPKAHKRDDPTYRHIQVSEIPVLEATDGKSRTRVVAGRVGQQVGPVITTGAPFVAHSTLLPGGSVALTPESVKELAVYVMVGSATIDNRRIEAAQLARLSAGGEVRASVDAYAEILIVGGDPLDAPIHRYGPFVMNSIADLEKAVRDYQSGRMGFLKPTRAA
jgi:quercetin 2,3-dioxygenase